MQEAEGRGGRSRPQVRGGGCREMSPSLFGIVRKPLATLLAYLCSTLHCRQHRGGGFSAGG